jgi:hypothetical protein
MCADPDCEASICKAAVAYNRALGAVRVIDSRETIRLFIQARLPLSRLLRLDCPHCGGDLFATAGQLVAWEWEQGEPPALVCGDACASRVAVMLARSLSGSFRK